MRVNTGSFLALYLLGLKVTGVLSAALGANIEAGLNRHIPANHAALQAECGNLGVLAVPEGANAADVRHCADQPIGPHRGTVSHSTSADTRESDKRDIESESTAAATPEKLFERDAQKCNTNGPPYGCDNHYCWRECGWRHGPWCWIAEGDGNGPWRKCRSSYDCRPATGGECGVGCKSCGCSCS